jgi:hypothetical protein
LLSRDMDNDNGHPRRSSAGSRAVDLLEQRRQQNRPWKVVKVRRGYQARSDEAPAKTGRWHGQASETLHNERHSAARFDSGEK